MCWLVLVLQIGYPILDTSNKKEIEEIQITQVSGPFFQDERLVMCKHKTITGLELHDGSDGNCRCALSICRGALLFFASSTAFQCRDALFPCCRVPFSCNQPSPNNHPRPRSPSQKTSMPHSVLRWYQGTSGRRPDDTPLSNNLNNPTV